MASMLLSAESPDTGHPNSPSQTLEVSFNHSGVVFLQDLLIIYHLERFLPFDHPFPVQLRWGPDELICEK